MTQRVIALWQEAETHQAAGRLAEAERGFREVVALTEGNPHPVDRLAQVLHGQGRLEEAWREARRASAGDPLEPVFHNTAARVADATGRLDHADRHYCRALLLVPGIALWAPLASLRYRAGNHQAAATAYRNALALTPGDVGLMFERAAAHHGAGELDEAARHYRAVLAAAPGHGPTLRNIAVLAGDRGEWIAASTWLSKALVIEPTTVELLRELGVQTLNRGDASRAFALHRRAVRLAPNDQLSWGALSDAGQRLEPDRPDLGGLRDLVSCMIEGIVSPRRLIGPVIALFRKQPGGVAACRAAASQSSAELAEQIARDGIPKAFDGDAFRALLGLSLLPDPDIEAGLTAIRSGLLRLAVDGRLDWAETSCARAWIQALAEQCQLNEHAWFEADADTALVEALERRLADERRWSPAALVLACFRAPVSRDPIGDVELARFEEMYVRSRVRERAIADELPMLTPIDDRVSETVRAQYEENPYPRWTTLPRQRSEQGPERQASSEREVLIAGCGTGQHALLAAGRYRDARILAVDLSRASLAYAERIRAAYGVDAVTFAQADILRLGLLERRFDVIESIGVLHHMERPIDGWRVLVGLLAPGGVMRIGLYSEIARRPVVSARAMIAGWGLGDTAPAIREARRRLILDRDNPDLAALFISPDFFGLSTCRDLLFHVQEHRFTVPELCDAMDELGLEFRGFETPSVTMARYKDRFPDDPTGLKLDNWETFEIENPGCFGAMYLFEVALRRPRITDSPE